MAKHKLRRCDIAVEYFNRVGGSSPSNTAAQSLSSNNEKPPYIFENSFSANESFDALVPIMVPEDYIGGTNFSILLDANAVVATTSHSIDIQVKRNNLQGGTDADLVTDAAQTPTAGFKDYVFNVNAGGNLAPGDMLLVCITFSHNTGFSTASTTIGMIKMLYWGKD